MIHPEANSDGFSMMFAKILNGFVYQQKVLDGSGGVWDHTRPTLVHDTVSISICPSEVMNR